MLVIPIITAWRATRPRDADISQTLWALGWVSLAVVGAAGRPPDYFAHAISDVLGITVLYFILSGTVMVRAIPALMWTAGDTFVLLTLRELERSLIVGIIGVLVLANAFGAVIAWQRTAFRREAFERWRSERELRLQ